MNLWTLFRTRLEHVRNSRLTRRELEARQILKFRRLVAHANRSSPYYRELIASRGICVESCSPSDFPILTKTDLMTHFDRISTASVVTRNSIADFLSTSKNPEDLFRQRYIVVHTSGTSGEVGYFVYSREDWARGVTQALKINPFSLRKRRLAFFGATDGHFTGVSFAVTSRWSLLRNLYEVETYSINSPLGSVIEGLNAFKPDILMGYPSALTILAEQQNREQLRISPRYCQCSGEPLRAGDRAIIEATFGVDVINTYACSEHLIMGFGKRDWGGIYLMEDDLMFELTSAHTVITNLFNYTVPLIRYQMNDVLERCDDPKPLFPFIKVKEIAGRRERIPFFTNQNGDEDFISPHVINEFLVRNVRRFQMHVVDKTSCFLRLCLEPGLNEAERERTLMEAQERFAGIFKEKMMANVSTAVQVVDELFVNPKTGKFELIVFPKSMSTEDSSARGPEDGREN